MNRVFVAMSGGVDSSVAALLLKKAGYDVTGVTMCLGINESAHSPRAGCCGPDAVQDAKRVAEKLSIPHYVLDFSQELEEKVVKRFVGQYLSGRTPNPCIDCNRYLKFDALLSRAVTLGFDALATGHYARIEKRDGSFLLVKARDRKKDQTYFLAGVKRTALPMILFPLASLTKDEVRRIATDAHLGVAEKPESQDICFVPDRDYGLFIEKRAGAAMPGPIVDTDGRMLGTHRGIPFYTVGQRGGLGITAPKPLYVIRMDAASNEIVVGGKETLKARRLICSDLNLLVDKIPERLTAKIRYTRKEAHAHVMVENETTMIVVFDEPQEAITPGQTIVFYKDDIVLGGAMIQRVADDSCTFTGPSPPTTGIGCR